MYLQEPALLNRIRSVAEAAVIRSDHAVRYEEWVALPYFGQIVLRFTITRDEVTLDRLDRYESMLHEIAGDAFLTDFMGSVYRKAGVDYTNLDGKLAALSERYADEPVIPSAHADGIRADAERLLEIAGLDPGAKAWEIQPERDGWTLLVMGERSRTIREIREPFRLTVAEVPAAPCTGLVKAAFYARRNGLSLGRLL